MKRHLRDVRSQFRWCVVALAAALATGSLAAAEPRWRPVGPPAAPQAARLFFDPTNGARGFALSGAGLWRSQSGGGDWRSIQVGLDGPPGAFAVDPKRPGRVYAVVNAFDDTWSIRRSDDFGDHWTVAFRSSDSRTFYPQDLQVDPFASDTLYLLTGEFLNRSRDGGRTWECFPVASGCVGAVNTVGAFALAPDRARTLYATSGNALFKTYDGGATWTQSTLFENQYPPDFLAATRAPRSLYAWSGPGYRGNLTPCFVRSDDEGETWKGYLRQTQCGAPAIDRDDPLTVRIVVLDGGVPQLRVSHEGGESWTNAGAVPAVGDLYVVPGKGLALVTDEGLFRSPGDQGPWRPANRGFAASQIGALLPTESGFLAAKVQTSFSIEPPAIPLAITEDGGRTWNNAPLINPIALAADPSDPRHLIASAFRHEGWTVFHSRVVESRDAGRTWRGVVDPQFDLTLDLFRSLAVDPFDPTTLYAGNYFGGFHRSTDGGRTWQASNVGLRLGGCHHYYCDNNWVQTILPDPAKSGAIAVLFERQVYGSDDGGRNWSVRGPVTQRQRQGSVRALTRDPQGALVALTTDLKNESLGFVHRSADGGATWKRLGRLPRLNLNSFGRFLEATSIAASPAGLFVGTNVFGVLRSADGGRTWKPFNDGLPLLSVSSLVADPFDSRRLYATVQQNGVYAIEVP